MRLSLLEIALIFVRNGGLVFGGAANVGPTLEAEMRAMLPAVIGIVAIAALKLARYHAGRPTNLLLIAAVQGFATGVSVGATGLIVASVWTLSAGAIVDAPTLGIALLA
ncbi:MAG TPA: hypothetical protein VGL23_06330, partial [Chloroflexota bacterium]